MWDLVSRPGIEPRLPALGAQSLSCWTTREVLAICIFKKALSDGPKDQLGLNTIFLLYTLNIREHSLTALFHLNLTTTCGVIRGENSQISSILFA